MSRLARSAVRRPRRALAVWLLVIAGLAIAGTGVEGRLTQSIFILPDTETAKATRLTAEEFGQSVFVPVLLEGPPAAVDRQGPRLVAAIDERQGWRALSPWDRGGAAERLRPAPGEAMIVASVSGPYEEIFDETADRIRELVGRNVSAPVSARITGMPVIGNSIKQHTYDSARHAERVALPILFLVLLLVFRAPIAALFPPLIGLTTVLASSGVIWLVAGSVNVDPLAISLASMMGLALGVDYSLLIVTRFREQIASGSDPPEAAREAMGTAGHTVAFAGGALVVAMGVGMIIAPGDILASAAIGIVTATVLGVGSAFVAIPAGLALFGSHIDRFRIGRPVAASSAGWSRRFRGALAHPGITALLVTIPLLLLCGPALGLSTGPPDVSQLPEDDIARQDFERVRDVMGPGWAAPFEVLVVSRDGAITTPRRLQALEDWQREVARDEDVADVIGPGQLARRVPDMDAEVEAQLTKLRRGTRGLGRLERGLAQLNAGTDQLAAAQRQAEDAARALALGAGRGEEGAAEIGESLGRVAGGAAQLQDAIGRMSAGGGELQRALAKMKRGTNRLILGIGFARDQLRLTVTSALVLHAQSLGAQADLLSRLEPRARRAQNRLGDALDELDAMGVGKADPHYAAARQAVLDAYGEIAGEEGADRIDPDPTELSMQHEIGLSVQRLRSASKDARRIARGTDRLGKKLGDAQQGLNDLRRGIGRLGRGADRLIAGTDAIGQALGRLHDGVLRIGDGAGELADGLGRLTGGADQLADGIASGGPRVAAFAWGTSRAHAGAEELHRRSRHALADDRLEQMRGLFDSGYFVLAGIEDAPSDRRAQAQVAVNVQRGGTAGRILVIPRSGPNADETADLRETLSDQAADLGDDLGVQAAVGGTAAALAEYDAATSSRLLWLVLGLAAVSYFILIPVFRSLLLPAIAVLLNLLSVGAAFGGLAILFQGENPILGGPGYVDAVSVSAMYTAIFGLSLDYQVFLITRMREGWDNGLDSPSAIAYGLDRTASVVTGAAAIMVAVFVAFAMTDVAGTRQFGAGMVVAVIIDATLVRLLLLPAVMRLAGKRIWRGPGSTTT